MTLFQANLNDTPIDHSTLLAPYAVTENNSIGRAHREPRCPTRSEFQRDRDRIIHCTAFRRLEYKTQVFVNHEGDLFRTRLTHSLEVAQIARSIARALHLNEDLTEAISLAHDLGHTPFGHAGQDSLNSCMKNFGGFEHNLQSLRFVEKLEQKYPQFNGLNLMFDTREGILKHCSLHNARQMNELGQRFINRTQPSLEAQLTNLADEIAYNNHDIDDGLRSGLITLKQLLTVEIYAANHECVSADYPTLGDKRKSYETIRRIINLLVSDLIQQSTSQLQENKITSVDDVRALTHPLITFSNDIKSQCATLKSFLHKNLYQHEKVYGMSVKANRIITDLFNVFLQDIKLMPEEHRQKAKTKLELEGEAGKARVVADYIAGMTDRFAIAEHERVFNLRLSY